MIPKYVIKPLVYARTYNTLVYPFCIAQITYTYNKDKKVEYFP